MGVDVTGQQTCSPELEVNGGELALSSYMMVGYQGTSAGVGATNKVVVNDGTVSCSYVTMGYANDANGSAPGRFEINGGEVRCAGGNFTVGNKSISGRQELYLNGGKLSCLNLTHTGTAGSTDVGSGAVYFRGGVLKPGHGRGVNSGITLGSTDAAKQMELYVGAAGAKFDLTDWMSGGEDAALIDVRNKFLKDPDCAGDDGGLWFYGKCTAVLRSQMSGSTFTGPIRATDGMMIGLEDTFTDSRTKTFIIEEGSGFRASAIFMYVNHLTLGTAGGTKPVLLDFCADRANVGLIVSNDVSILSPVTVSFHRPGGACNTVGAQLGTYGVLYYPAALDSQIDLSKFVPNPQLPEVTMTFTKADSDYAATAAGMRMVKVTITAAASTVGTTWTGAANDGQWTTDGNWNGEAPDGRDGGAHRALRRRRHRLYVHGIAQLRAYRLQERARHRGRKWHAHVRGRSRHGRYAGKVERNDGQRRPFGRHRGQGQDGLARGDRWASEDGRETRPLHQQPDVGRRHDGAERRRGHGERAGAERYA